mgnify:FL=1
MKKVLLFLCYVVSAGLFVGAYEIDYYTAAKLGMNRWVNFNTAALLEKYPLDTMVLALGVAMLVLIAIGAVRWVARKRELRLYVPFTVFAAACAAVWFFHFRATSGVSDNHAYYFILLCEGLGGIVLALIAVFAGRKKRGETSKNDA